MKIEVLIDDVKLLMQSFLIGDMAHLLSSGRALSQELNCTYKKNKGIEEIGVSRWKYFDA
jgi:hypothetical protein